MKPTYCECAIRVCLMPTTTTRTTTTMSATLPTTVSTTESTSAPTASAIDANQTLQESNSSSAITMPAAQSPKDNAALIGGIVGGAVGLLLVGVLIAVCVARNRRQPKAHNASALHSVHSTTAPSESNYSSVPPSDSPEKDNYGRVPLSKYGGAVLHSPIQSHYDSLKPSEIAEPA
jgi:hypothetical protein